MNSRAIQPNAPRITAEIALPISAIEFGHEAVAIALRASVAHSRWHPRIAPQPGHAALARWQARLGPPWSRKRASQIDWIAP